jgi:hypothetical protein
MDMLAACLRPWCFNLIIAIENDYFYRGLRPDADNRKIVQGIARDGRWR